MNFNNLRGLGGARVPHFYGDPQMSTYQAATGAAGGASAATGVAASTAGSRGAVLVEHALSSIVSDRYPMMPIATRQAVVASAVARFKRYASTFRPYAGQPHGPSIKSLFEQLEPRELAHLIKSRQTISRLPEKSARAGRDQCDVQNLAMRTSYGESNAAMSGYAKSAFTSGGLLGEELRMPRGLVSTLDTDYFQFPGNERRLLKTITVMAPALDSALQPEFPLYTDAHGRLNKQKYAEAFAEIAKHVESHVAVNSWLKRVVLAGAGSEAFVFALNPEDREAAREIQADTWAKLVVSLRAMGRDVAFSDKATNAPLWQNVNSQLLPHQRIANVGKAPGPWMTPADALFNCGDKAAYRGNECTSGSQEGALGAASTMHPVDVVRAALTSSLAENGVGTSPFMGHQFLSPASPVVLEKIAAARASAASPAQHGHQGQAAHAV